MKKLRFSDTPMLFEDSSAFVAHIGQVKGKRELCHQLSQKLHFPLLVNSHWDALLDFLCDFNWIEQCKVILIHDDLVQLNIHDFHTYLEILLESIND